MEAEDKRGVDERKRMSSGTKADLKIPPHTVVTSLQVRSKMKVKGVALPIETNLKKQQEEKKKHFATR